MNRNFDEYDLALIKHLKTNNPTITGIMEIYGRRNAVDVAYVRHLNIAEWMLKLVETYCTPYNRDLFNLAIDLHDDNQWKFNSLEMGNSYWEKWIRVLGSRLRLTEVKYFPNWPTSVFN